MSLNEPLHDPADLSDELDAVICAQELLRQRVIALQGRYRALEAHAEAGQFDKPSDSGSPVPEEFGCVNVEWTAKNLDVAAGHMAGTLKYSLRPARELAVKVREYQPERTAQPSALADSRPGNALVERAEVDEGRSL
ncbi:hypothetical protein ACWEKR_27840 [Nocardia sp. NPDC004573]